jgi:general secretion pathway protein F
MLKIVPVFAKMFEEFSLELPGITQAVIAVSSAFVSYWFLLAPLFLLLLFLFGIGVLYYIGWLPRDVPLLNRLALRHDASVVLRTLALAVRNRIALGTMIELLSQLHPKWSICTRLADARDRIAQGTDWCDSLHAVSLLRSVDVAVLKSAERVGNLAWALDEMAESSLRQLAYRLRLWLNILFPIVLLVFGTVVAFHVVGLFLPLVSLIQGLS